MNFPITVLIDGQTIEVPNCLMVIALAIRDVKWAVDLCNDPVWSEQTKMILNGEGNYDGGGI